MMFIISLVLNIVLIVIGIILSVAYLVYFERKIIAAMQLRQGPHRVGPFGILQPISDAIKLLLKKIIIPNNASNFLFIIAPMITFCCGICVFAVIPVDRGQLFADINVGILYLLAVSGINVYSFFIAGYASQNLYSRIAMMRSIAQMISYEIVISTVILSVVLLSESFDLSVIVTKQNTIWYIVPLFPLFIIFIIASLCETNRVPFDLPEAESEIVGGYNAEYGGILFGMFFLGEYANMILASAVCSILFLGGWYPPILISSFLDIPGYVWFMVKVSIILFIFIWTRATLPRYKFDHLIHLCWVKLMPISFLYFVIIAVYKYIFSN